VHELAKSMCISIAIVWRRLTRALGFVVKHLHLVPHSLTEAQPQIRIDRSIELLRCLEFAQANEWQSIMTLDESWFYLWTSHETVRIQAGQQPKAISRNGETYDWGSQNNGYNYLEFTRFPPC
jgi:hypothetical protein